MVGHTPHPCTSRFFCQNATRVPTFFTPSRLKGNATSLMECPCHHEDVRAEAKPRLGQLKTHIPRRLAGEASRGGDFTAEIWRQERT